MTPARDWFYLKVHPVPGADLDVLATSLVGGLAGLLDGDEVTRWFWLRYVDRVGVHLRLRALTTAWTAERLAAATRTLAPAGSRLRPGHYEPEHAVFGGTRGTELAEQEFEVSSRLTVALLRVPVDERDRLQLARELVSAAVTRSLPDAARVDYLRDVATYWTNAGQPPAALPAPTAAADQLGRRALVAGSEVYERWLSGLVRPAELAGVPGAPGAQGWLFRLVHLTLNRLGIPPAVEAAVAAELAGTAPSSGTPRHPRYVGRASPATSFDRSHAPSTSRD